MDIYRILKIFGIKGLPDSLKLIGLGALILTERRYLGVFIDPVLACNLRCKMCYFSDPEKRKEMKGVMSESQLKVVKEKLLPNALKLQIGCGAEPTLYPDLPKLVAMGREAKVPYISLTTNGMNLIKKQCLEDLVTEGLNELTLSIHGTTKEIYEDLMPDAEYEKLLELIEIISKVKQRHNKFQLRINFTVNSLNSDNLRKDEFFEIFDKFGLNPDIIQIRPVQKIGNSEWTDFDLQPIIESYEETIGNIALKAKKRGILCLYPTKENLLSDKCETSSSLKLMEETTYCYVSKNFIYNADFQYDKESLKGFHKRIKTLKKIITYIFSPKKKDKINTTKKLNYTID